MRLERRRIDLPLLRPWTLSRGTSTSKSNVLIRLSHGEHHGLGEAAPNPRYGEDCESVLRALERAEPLLDGDPGSRDAILGRVDASIPRHPAARAAIDIALHDLAARRIGQPLHRLLGADPSKAPLTSFSIGIADVPAMQEQARQATGFRILKIKLGTGADRDLVQGIRAVTDKPLYADANEGWKDPAQAIAMIRWLEGMGVVLIEQPLPAGDLEGAMRVRDQVSMPIFADEAALAEEDLPAVARAYDGVNVKLQKSGGLRSARRMIEAARAHGLRVMLGCMIETSVGITAAAHLAPLADHADLDGHLHLRDDPFRGALLKDGRIVPPEGPGLGVEGAW